MSFSRKVKEELGGQISRARHCQIAELAALFSCCGHVVSQGERNFFVKFTTENLTVAKKYSILIKKVFHFDIEMSVRGHQYLIYILNPEDALIFLQALKILEGKALVHELVIQRNCCKRAFIRGIFLACGSVTDPERGYHLEMAVGTIGWEGTGNPFFRWFCKRSKSTSETVNPTENRSPSAKVTPFSAIRR